MWMAENMPCILGDDFVILMLYNGCLNGENIRCEVLELENWVLDGFHMMAESCSFGLWNENCVLDVGMCC